MGRLPEAQTDPVLIQPYLQGTEYGMDVVNDLQGNFRTAAIRQKLAMRSGETDRARTLHNAALWDIGRKLVGC